MVDPKSWRQPDPGRGMHVAPDGRALVLRRTVRDALERAGVMAAGQEQENILII